MQVNGVIKTGYKVVRTYNSIQYIYFYFFGPGQHFYDRVLTNLFPAMSMYFSLHTKKKKKVAFPPNSTPIELPENLQGKKELRLNLYLKWFPLVEFNLLSLWREKLGDTITKGFQHR